MKLMQENQGIYKILLLLDYSSEFERNLLRGIVKYSNDFGPWLFYRLPPSYKAAFGDQAIVDYARKWKADAIVGRWDNDIVDLQKELDIPVIIQNYRHRRTTCANLTGDYSSAGHIAAQFFIRKGYRHFAFFGLKSVVWSEERKIAYKEDIDNAGGTFACFEYEKKDDTMRTRLSAWLMNLPKPVALFCCDDENALYVSETCMMHKMNIPKQIALLGVDNDELMCNISCPPISSIEQSVEAGGYAIGELIHEMLVSRKFIKKDIVISPTRVVARKSTDENVIEDKYVSEVVCRIENEYASPLTVNDLLSNIPLSRRSFEIKFRRATNTSIYKYILYCRCRHLADKLLTTRSQIIDLSMEVGFDDYNNVSRIFKKIYGCTPSEYRSKRKRIIL